MTLGATPFSIYQTYTPEQIEYLISRLRRAGGARRAGVPRPHARGAQGAARPRARDRGRRRGARGRHPPRGRRGVQPRLRRRGLLARDPGRTTCSRSIYTSGTTGPPKGVQLSHANMMDVVASVEEIIGLPEGIRVISWLPSAHVAERNAHHYIPIVFGRHDHVLREPARGHRATCPRCGRPGSSPSRASGRSSRRASRRCSQSQPDEQREKVERAIAAAREKVRLEQAGEEVPGRARRGGARPPTRSSSPACARCSASTRSSRSTSAPRPRRSRCSSSSTPSASRSPSCGACPRSTGAGTCNRPGNIKIGTVGPAAPGMRGQARRRRRGADPRRLRDAGLPQPAREDRRDDRRGRLAAHRRHRRDRRGRLPQDRRPQEGADHQRGRQEHVAGQHRGEAQDGRAR